MTFNFEGTDAYKRAVAFSHRIFELTRHFPEEHAFLRDELRKTSVSISLNLAEGAGLADEKDSMGPLMTAVAFCSRCVPLLEFLSQTGLFSLHITHDLRKEIDTIADMLVTLMNKSGKIENN